MATFVYQALGANGQQRGVLTARSQAEAVQQLERLGLVPMSVTERSGGLLLHLTKRRVNPAQLADAVRNLSDLLATGGVPLLQALASLQQEESSPAMAEVLAGLRAAVEEGRPLAEAMAARPDVFPEVVVRIIGASEARGDLDRALNEAARYLERGVNAASKVRGALAYPAFVLAIAVGVVVFMSVGVMPQLAEMFIASGVSLPLVTRLLLGFGTTLSRFWYLVLSAVVCGLFALRWALRQSSVRRRMDALAWRLPGVRLFVRNFAYGRWAMTVGLMHASGVPLLATLQLARGVAGNIVLQDALEPVAGLVRDGQPLSRALRATGAFPATVAQIVALGEEHGTLSEMLQRVGRRYDVQTERLLEKLPAFIEPVFIVVIGVLVGGMLLALYWPLLNVYQLVKGG